MIPNIPDEIIQAANRVAHWMKQNGYDRWELADICSRDHAEELKAYRECGVTEEILRRNDGCIKVGRGCAIVRASDLPNNRI